MDTISRENNNMLPVGAVIVGVIALLLAAYSAISLSKQKRADAYEGRRSIRGRLYQQEEHIMRAQVINFDPGHAVVSPRGGAS